VACEAVLALQQALPLTASLPAADRADALAALAAVGATAPLETGPQAANVECGDPAAAAAVAFSADRGTRSWMMQNPLRVRRGPEEVGPSPSDRSDSASSLAGGACSGTAHPPLMAPSLPLSAPPLAAPPYPTQSATFVRGAGPGLGGTAAHAE
jgi:hypothetical protein